MNEYGKTRKLYSRVVKPLLDKIFGLLFLIFFFWLYLICFIAVIMDDGFPAIYKQQRVGKNGKQFNNLKFINFAQW